MSERPEEPFFPPITTTEDGEAIFLTCQFCEAQSEPIPFESEGIFYCGVCHEWGAVVPPVQASKWKPEMGDMDKEDVTFLSGPSWTPPEDA